MNLKYGLLFCLLGAIIVALAATQRGWAWLALWPGASFIAVGLGYLLFGSALFGKGARGVIPLVRFLVLAPFLIYTWLVWHMVRKTSREAPYHRLSHDVYIGRRLLAHELPPDVECVIDLTSEFHEPRAIRRLAGYRSFPILDAHTPRLEPFLEFLRQFERPTRQTIYIHCAQGHGRTALAAASLLILRQEVATVDEALAVIARARPQAVLNAAQRRFLHAFAARLRE